MRQASIFLFLRKDHDMNDKSEIDAQSGSLGSAKVWIRPQLNAVPIAKTASGLTGSGEAVTMDDSVAS